MAWCFQEMESFCPWPLSEVLSKASLQPGSLKCLLGLNCAKVPFSRGYMYVEHARGVKLQEA